MKKLRWSAESDKTFELCAKQVENADKVLAKYAGACMWHSLSLPPSPSAPLPGKKFLMSLLNAAKWTVNLPHSSSSSYVSEFFSEHWNFISIMAENIVGHNRAGKMQIKGG